MGWLGDFRQDLQRYVEDGSTPLKALLTQQGLWALLEYRLAQAGRRLPFTGAFFVAWQKAVETVTGISLGHGARIGPGLWIGHFGGVIVLDEAVIGRHCHLCQGVTIGRGVCLEGYGVPVLGDDVYVGPHAVLLGTITIGDGARIGANVVVNESVEPGVFVRPAAVVVEPSYEAYCERTRGDWPPG